MKIEYINTLDDFSNFLAYHHKKYSLTAKIIKNVSGSAFLIPLAWRFLARRIDLPGESLSILPFVAAGFGLNTILSTTFMGKLLYKKTAQWIFDEMQASNSLNHQVTIYDECLVEQVNNKNIERSWDSIKRVAADEEYAFIYYDEKSAAVIPKRAFEDEASFNAWVKRAKELAKCKTTFMQKIF